MASCASGETWQVRLDAAADAYVATLKLSGIREPLAVVRVPRRTLDDAVLMSAEIALELAPEARIAAYAGSTARTLTAATLLALVAEAVAPESLSAEEASVALARLETELQQALEMVRRARAAR